MDTRAHEKGRTAQLNFVKALLRYLGAILAAPQGNQGGWEGGARGL